MNYFSTYIACSWFVTAGEQVPILSGKVAGREFLTRILNIIVVHDRRIRCDFVLFNTLQFDFCSCLDTFICYHYGNKFLVELHVVMDPNLTLMVCFSYKQGSNDESIQESHDISEPLEFKLLKLPYVERAFVHCDYRVDSAER